jgi:hypothetical protein
MNRSLRSRTWPHLSGLIILQPHPNNCEWKMVDELPALIHLEPARLFVAGSVRRIIGGLDFREPLHAGGMEFGYAVFESSALNRIFDLAIAQKCLQE